MRTTAVIAAVLATLALPLGLTSCAVAADPAPSAADKIAEANKAAAASPAAPEDVIAKAMKINRSDVRPSQIPGLYEIKHDHDFGFVSADGKYFVHGDMLEIESGKNLTENARRADRIAALASLGENSTIDFAPSPPIAEKYVVTVFTDVDCGYCRRMHSQVADYNKLGITIRYAFFPRSGPNTESWSKAEAVWCSSDRRGAFTKAKQGMRVSARKCINPVDDDFKLGYQLGVRGTPMIFLQNGEEIPGYLPPDELIQELTKSDTDAAPATGKLDPPIASAQ
jgi:thiol:disulfide interchange protein DsbC